MVDRKTVFWANKRVQLAAAVTVVPAALLGARCAQDSQGGGADVRFVPRSTVVVPETETSPTPFLIPKEPTAVIVSPTVGTTDPGPGKGTGAEATLTTVPTEVPTATAVVTQRPTEAPPAATQIPPTPRPTEAPPTPVPTPAPTEKPVSADFFNREKASQIINAINAYRISRGLPPYKMNQLLTKAAEDFAMQQAPLRRSGHEGIDGSTPVTRVQRVGYKFGGVAEIATGSVSPDPNQLAPASSYLGAWQDSPSHNDALLMSGLTEIGVGCFASARAIEGQWYEVCYVDIAKPGDF